MSNVLITDVRCILTAPEGKNLIVVKVETNEPEIYGVGCATFMYRELAVKKVVDDYLKPLLVGRNVDNVGELWQLMYQNAYWRNDVISNNAISGVDMALWDIKGKIAGLPLYSLLGGKYREAAMVYRHAGGNDLAEIADNVAFFMDQGVDHIRVQWGNYGGNTPSSMLQPEPVRKGIYYSPKEYMLGALNMFEYIRKEFGDSLDLLHDCHERLAPNEAVWFAQAVEDYRLFFLEDVLSPEQSGWLQNIRQRTSTPIALGELFTHPKEFDQLISNRLIDFVRCHITSMGGLTPALKLTHFAEFFDIRTAWHGPKDVSPIGHAVNIHLDVSSKNFGIQEWSGISEKSREVFVGSPVRKGGFVYPSETPGIGIEFNETLAKKYPHTTEVTMWTHTRLPDGTLNVP